MVMDMDQILVAIKNLTDASEKRAKEELERSLLEECRIKDERLRLQLEQENNVLLNKIMDGTTSLINTISDYSGQDYENVINTLETISTLVQVIALRVTGSELQTLVEAMRAVGGSKLQIRMGDAGHIRSIIEGSGNTVEDSGDSIEGSQYNISVENLSDIVDAIETGDPVEVEKEINSLPGDVVDVILAALQGPLAAAKMIVKKVGAKWKVLRESAK